MNDDLVISIGDKKQSSSYEPPVINAQEQPV
jgi:hypothetical protein